MKIDTNESALDLKRTEALLATYLCPIAEYLEEIRETQMTPHERFLIVWAKDREEYYVQCMFFDNDKQIHCEAASGYYYEPAKGFVTAEKRETLAELGFSTDASAGNFARELRLDDRGTRLVAKLIIATLARVYDLGPSDKLEYTAPLLSAERVNPVIVDPERCPVPTSSLRRALALSAILAGHP
ncbi:MAG: TY-Chap domain-containing protein [Methylocella sp.]